MPTPLVMLGSGDYATRLNVKGTRLIKTKGPQGNTSTNPDPDQAPNHFGYHRQTFNRGKFSPTKRRDSSRPHRESDTFNLTAPLHAAAAWLQLQSLTLSDLAQTHHQLAAALPTPTPNPSQGLRSNATKPRIPQPKTLTPDQPQQPAFVRALRAAKAKLRAQQPAPRIAITPVPVDFVDAPALAPTPSRGLRSNATKPRIPNTSSPNPQPLTPQTSPTRRDPNEPHAQTAQNPQPHPRNPLDPRLFADDAGTRRRAGRLQGHRLRTRRSADQKRSPQTAGQQSPLFGSVA